MSLQMLLVCNFQHSSLLAMLTCAVQSCSTTTSGGARVAHPLPKRTQDLWLTAVQAAFPSRDLRDPALHLFQPKSTLFHGGIHFGLQKHPEPGYLLTLELVKFGADMVADEV